MAHLAFEYFQNVEADGQLFPRTHEKVFGDADIPLFLFISDRLCGRAESLRQAGLDFAENDRVSVIVPKEKIKLTLKHAEDKKK